MKQRHIQVILESKLRESELWESESWESESLGSGSGSSDIDPWERESLERELWGSESLGSGSEFVDTEITSLSTGGQYFQVSILRYYFLFRGLLMSRRLVED